MEKIEILLADDHLMTRGGLRAVVESMPGWVVCGEAANGREAVEMTAKLRPKIVVMDVAMPELNGLDATREIKKMHPDTEVLIFSGTDTERMVRDVFEAGARSYILKTASREEIEAALRALAAHKSYFTTEVGEILFAKMLRGKSDAKEDSGEGRLTDRERMVVQLLAEGASNKDVAQMLGISVTTVETHRAAIMKRLRLNAFSELVRYAIRNQIVSA